jgi:small-conductance mechanosensitive channel
MFILYVAGKPIGTALPFVCFIIWTATLFVILDNSKLTVFVRRVSRTFLIAAPLIFVLYQGGTTKFLSDLDRFSVDVLHRTTAVVTSPDSEHARPEFKVSHLLKAVFFFIQAFLVASYYGKMWHYRRVEKQRRESNAAFEQESVEKGIFILSIAISLWISFVLLGFDTLSVSIFSGFVALSASVALRDLLTNFLAGILLLWGKSVKLGDVIAIDKARVGEVKSIGLRHMEIEDRNDISYLVPHSHLLNTVVENWTKTNRQVRLKLDVGVAYDSPIEKVKDIMRSVCFDVPRVLQKPLPNPLIVSMDDSSIHFQLRFRIKDPELGIRNVMSDVYEKLLERFKKADIEIPFPQREVRMRSLRDMKDDNADSTKAEPTIPPDNAGKTPGVVGPGR